MSARYLGNHLENESNMSPIKNLLLVMSAIFIFASQAFAEEGKKGSYEKVDTPASTSQQVKIGFYPISVYQLDMASNTYYIDTYVWLRWFGAIDPTVTIEFTNMVEEWGKQQENLLETPSILADGSKYQIMRLEGRFVQPFSLADYPLDKQKLSIMVEDTANGADVISYVIDSESSGVGTSIQIPGWQLNGWTAQSFKHDYGSNFGEDSTASIYSATEFSININRPMSFFYWKLLLPLFIVLSAALASLYIKPTDLGVRTALPSGSLLTAIFLQKSYSDALPDLGYLVLMDKLYLVTYSLIILTLIRAILAFKSIENANEDVVKSVQNMDRKLFFALLLLFVIAVVSAVSLQ